MPYDEIGEPLPYADETFDLAVCALAIHYVEDRPAAFLELYRVLRPGGALVVSTQHPTADWLRKGTSSSAGNPAFSSFGSQNDLACPVVRLVVGDRRSTQGEGDRGLDAG